MPSPLAGTGDRRPGREAHNRDRTGDLILTKDVLCQLSYVGDFLIGDFEAPTGLRRQPLTRPKKGKSPCADRVYATQISRNLFPRFLRKSGGKLTDAAVVSKRKCAPAQLSACLKSDGTGYLAAKSISSRRRRSFQRVRTRLRRVPNLAWKIVVRTARLAGNIGDRSQSRPYLL